MGEAQTPILAQRPSPSSGGVTRPEKHAAPVPSEVIRPKVAFAQVSRLHDTPALSPTLHSRNPRLRAFYRRPPDAVGVALPGVAPAQQVHVPPLGQPRGHRVERVEACRLGPGLGALAADRISRQPHAPRNAVRGAVVVAGRTEDGSRGLARLSARHAPTDADGVPER